MRLLIIFALILPFPCSAQIDKLYDESGVTYSGDLPSPGTNNDKEILYSQPDSIDEDTGFSDQDGLTNYKENLANTDPKDSARNLPNTSVLLYWTRPTQREDGTQLAAEEIAYYEISYQRSASTDEIIIDNQSPNFVSYGSGGVNSSSIEGYIGSDYLYMPPGSGEIMAEWRTYALSPGSEYRLDANWTSHSNHGSKVVYQYIYSNNSGEQITETVGVNQKKAGGTWQQLARFETSDSVVTVRIYNNSDGYVIADAIRLTESPPTEKNIIVKSSPRNNYVIENLAEGDWQFKIRVVDSEGRKSVYSEIIVHRVE